MKISLMSNGPELSDLVADTFNSAQWLLVVEEENGSLVQAIPREGRSDTQLAGLIVESGSEGVLCGPIEKEPFLIIADEGGVTRYLASGLSGVEALGRFRGRNLEFIRDYVGGRGHRHQGGGREECSGSH